MAIDSTIFKDYFDRGQFLYGPTVPDVRDKDIDQAIAEARAVFNPDLYPVEDQDLAELYLTAHFLQTDLSAEESGGQSILLQSARSVDGVSESLAVPDWMLEGELAAYSTTYWGQKFLTLSRPYMGGGVFVVGGTTLP